MVLLIAGSLQASALFGAAWVPPGAGVVAWDAADGWSDTLAGEFDGLLRPPLTAHGGWVGRTDAVLGGLALVRFTDATFADVNSYQGVGGTRFSVDYRRWLHARAAREVGFYGDAGAYYVLPNAENRSDGYTAEEQASADEEAAGLRARIGGLGAQVGVGAEYPLADAQGRPAVSLGLRYLARVFRAQATGEEGYSVSTVWLTEAALTLEFTR